MNDPISMIKTTMYWVLDSVMIARSFGRKPVRGGIPANEHSITRRIK
jgi:hypothetical protein